MPEFSPAFLHSLNFVIRPDVEGGYVNDPTDRGGETKYGISDRRDGVIDGKTDVNGDGKPDTRIKDLTHEQAAQIYWRDYWLAAKCNEWPDGVSLFVFDAAVQHGVKRAIQILQAAAGVDDDGIVGKNTRAAVLRADTDWLLLQCFLRRSRYYAGIIKSSASQGKYLNGWFNRLDLLASVCREVLHG
ncbi:TPA: peptidoglycan-binding protein [Escherichia coli]|uniref:glycoside hydrolase family 108 protein n=1 Tax=Escherichia TaxID=561 RepID=UPI0003910D9D|nr:MULTISPECIES: N-acetylmuramidase [Escherichia]EBS9358058.1 peptidoglycan-binding protein [Salmonella enterica]EEY2333426.1 peptidoglycan-binding protein [Escherichia coli]EFX7531746.1 peptidoglycan-binding protein [Shigella flexneri]EHN3789776.1 peptidoglycan-binding protein [Salmonella enterica subsp. enterica serovar Infantis]EIH3010405.1 peptidoglycan-binding protein [Salmonella enterica subsp. enterica serovar Adelaide]MCZ8594970.1 peptidoglycan-binding protein [Escherichia albertii]H